MIISFEGINFSGKTTQLSYLDDTLRSHGWRTTRFAFPSDETPVGSLLRSTLRGERQIATQAMLALFAVNRLERLDEIVEADANGHVVLCDRYSESEYAYGGARGFDRAWLDALESRMPSSNLVILLDLDYDTAIRRRIGERPLDIFERDREYIKAVRQEYLLLAAEKHHDWRTWATIDATLSPDEIRARIWRSAESLLEMRS